MNVESQIANIVADKSARLRDGIEAAKSNAARRIKECMTELESLPATARRDVELAAKVEDAGFTVRFRTYMDGFTIQTCKEKLLALARVLGPMPVENRGLKDYSDPDCNTVEVELKPRKYPFVAVYYEVELTQEEQAKPGMCKVVTETRTTRSLVCSR